MGTRAQGEREREAVSHLRSGNETAVRLTQPLVVGLVDVLVEPRVVLETVDPVDACIGKDKEEGHAEDGVRQPIVADVVVQQRVASDLAQEPGQGEEVERGKRVER